MYQGKWQLCRVHIVDFIALPQGLMVKGEA